MNNDYLKAAPADLRWWLRARFGMFIHWGPVSLLGKEIGWSRGTGPSNVKGYKKVNVPVRVYDRLYQRFNPVKFDARRWVALAQAAGMKYMVFTTKHHDGFCMFDSKLTDYKITNSPIGRDLTAELAAACHEAGLPIGFYYSQPDWRHPDCYTDRHHRYLKYFHGQIAELCNNYGKVDIFWFDLGGTPLDWDSHNLFKMIRRLQPKALINNRCGLPGDFDTPEQRIGAAQTHRPWESCITIGTQWAFKPRERIKPLSQCIRTLVTCAGGDGNLLFNVGPLPDGSIHPSQASRLREMGGWLSRYGHSIYATRGGPFGGNRWRTGTIKGKSLFLHIFDPGRSPFVLPCLAQKVISSSMLTGGSVRVRQMAGGTEIAIPRRFWDPLDTIVEIEFDRPLQPLATGG